MYKYQPLLLIFLAIIFLTACGEKPAEQIYLHLEKAVVLEEVFEQQQQPLVEAEMKEHELYEEIISLGMAEYDTIVELSQEAISFIEERQELIDKEKMSIEAGYSEFIKIEDFILELDGVERTIADQLKEKMTLRYDTYMQLHDKYSEALNYDKQLYEMLQKEELTIDELQQQIDTINEAYQVVMDRKESFNVYTEEYNELKKDFYHTAGLEVRNTEKES